MVKSKDEDVDIPPLHVGQALLLFAAAHGDKVALVNGITDESYTFSQYADASKRVASALFRRNIGRGKMVALHCQNCPEFAITMTAVLLTGATITPASTAFVPAELERQLSDSKATYLIAGESLLNISKEAARRYGKIKELIVIGGNSHGCTPFADLLRDDGSAFRDDVSINPSEDIATLPYSSGTTGLPKGVMVTHRNIIANLSQIGSPRLRGSEPRTEQDVTLGLLPMYHSYGLVVTVLGGIAGGSKIICLPKFQPETFFRAIEKYKIKYLPLVPPLVNFMSKYAASSKYDLSSIERVGAGAAPLSQAQENEFRQKYKVGELKQGYGLTESTVCLAAPPHTGVYKPGTVGEPISLTELKIMDPETLEELGPNKRGEIWARGPQIMKGYFNKPKATAEVIDEDGWFHTGDIGYYDEDGLFFVVDRMKELIKYKGLQVAPAELEGILLSHPAVQDCGVIGVPDERAGELPKAFIVLKSGHRLTANAVHEFIKDQVSSYKHLRGGVEFIDEIPRALSGKILRRVLRDQEKKSKL